MPKKIKSLIWLIIALAVIVFSALILTKDLSWNLKQESVPSQTIKNEPTEEIISAFFTCVGNKNIRVSFHNQKDEAKKSNYVELLLSDGRQFILPQAISADGARYASEDESRIFWNKGDGAFLEESGRTTFSDCRVSQTLDTNPAASLANPASVNCEKQGGRSVIETKDDGSQYGLCYFDDNRACEEWAMLRGDCPVGGVKTTGYDTQAQRFCAWSGGQTSAVPQAVCRFKDGSRCLADDFYSGVCQMGR